MMKNIFLTDDDTDDCSLFSEALLEVHAEAKLTINNNGVKLMEALDQNVPPTPEVIFLDLNMPLKNGFECLEEIRQTKKLKSIPIIIFSTSSNNDIIEQTYLHGANYYICKPNSFSLLKKSIEAVLSLNPIQLNQQPLREKYVIKVA